MSGAVAMAGGIDPLNDREFQALRVLIRQLTGIHLADGKRELVSSRLRRRVQALGMSSYGQYHDHVARGGGGPAERTALINCITTNKTDFFREPHHFVFLRRLAAKWRQRPPAGRALRIWSAGCSTGEEPYSISIALHDLLPAGAGWDVRVLASDIDTDVLAHAREGFYRPERLADLPRSAERYFVRENDGLRVVPEIRERVDFRQVNLIGEWNLPERFDLVFCRNVVIYFDRETQERLFTRFARQLSPGGHLLIGHSESVLGLQESFAPAGQTVYRRRGLTKAAGGTGAAGVAAPAPASSSSASSAWASSSSSMEAAPPVAPPAPGPAAPPAPATTARTATERRQGLRIPTRAATEPGWPAPDAPLPVAPGRRPRVPRAATEPGRPAPQAAAVNDARSSLIQPGSPPHIRIVVGDAVACREPTRLSTLLGSCVSACLFDPVAGIGGMNHFLLPSSETDPAASARYGIHAMELLINEIMRLGGDRRRLKAKLFGASSVLDLAASNVPARNAAFAREFLVTEGIPLVAERLEGDRPLEIHFFTDTGRALVRTLVSASAIRAEEERAARVARELAAAPLIGGGVELWAA